MKFDFIIGNPPYQEETESDSTRMPPIYNYFMEQAYELGDSVELITPARFLFNTGFTPKAWNEKMLNDPHFCVQYYEPNSRNIFPNADIKGGIIISYHDKKKDYDPIVIFTKFPELNKILTKVKENCSEFLDSIIFSNLSYKVSDLMKLENPSLINRLRTNAFTSLSNIFFETPPDDEWNYIAMIGLLNAKRAIRYIRRDYIQDSSGTLDKYTLLLPSVNGSGEFGEALSPSVIANPGTGYTQTFIGIGAFDQESEAKNVAKYVKTKFARAMLGILKITQHCPGPRWAYVPLQDFTAESDIDWSKSIPDIDRQLYAKYGLDDAEIEFIETHVKEMN